MVSAKKVIADMAISDLLKGLNKSATPACSAKTEPLGLITVARLVDLRHRFADKFERGHECQWATVQNIETGQDHQCLFNLKFWPDPHYLELAIGCHLAVEPDSNFLRGSGWARQSDALKETVIARLEDPSLIEQTTAPLVTEDVKPVERVEIDNGAMHPCIPAMNQIIAAVGREAKASGLVAAGYIYVDPAVFFK